MISSLASFARRPSWLRLASLPPAESHYRDEMRRAASQIVGYPLPGSTVLVIRRADSDEAQIWPYYPVNLVNSRGSPSSLEYRSPVCALAHSKNLSSLLNQATPHQVTKVFFSSWGRGSPDIAHSKARASDVRYHVFLSFSGDDTRYNFTGFVHQALVRAKLRVFLDQDDITVGDEIDESLLQAIDNSHIYIPIISQTYPDRKWCLIELQRMMNNVSESNGRKRIFPIFYKVEPGIVKHRPPHTENLSSEVKPGAFEALAKVGKIKGWKVKEQQSQAKIVDSVVRKVLEELGRKDESQTEQPIELDHLTQSFEDSYNCAVMRLAGRGSLSRGSIGRETSLSSTSTEWRWRSLSINRMEGMYMEEGSVSTGRSGSSRSRGSSGRSRRTSSSRRGRSGGSGSSWSSSGEEEAGEAVRGSFQDICLGAFFVCLFHPLYFNLSLLNNKETSQ